MPFRDHFRPPISDRKSWEGFHGGWPMVIVLQTWYRPLNLGETLPCLPLWLSETLAIPLDLEASYEQTCVDLKIPGAVQSV